MELLIGMLIIWMVSIIMSLGIDKVCSENTYKILADYGYIPNVDEDDNILDYLKDDKAYTLIPLLNIFTRLKHYHWVMHNANSLFDALNEREIIRPMIAEEQKYYTELPNYKRVVEIYKRSEYEFSRVQNINLTLSDNLEGEIYYRVSEDEENLEIIDSTGACEDLDDQNKIECIYNCWLMLMTERTMEFSSVDKMLKDIDSKNYYKMVLENSSSCLKQIEFNYNKNEYHKLINYFDKTLGLDNDEDLTRVKIKSKYRQK